MVPASARNHCTLSLIWRIATTHQPVSQSIPTLISTAGCRAE